MKQEGQKGPWYQDREELLFPRGHMGAFWIGDFHYQNPCHRVLAGAWC